jgi:hypothetical protein
MVGERSNSGVTNYLGSRASTTGTVGKFACLARGRYGSLNRRAARCRVDENINKLLIDLALGLIPNVSSAAALHVVPRARAKVR